MTSERDTVIRALERGARSELSSDSVIAVRPDHPFLLSGPEILIGSRGALLAIFLGKMREKSRPKELVARITAVRLALPAHAICVAEASNVREELAHHFDQMFEFKRREQPLAQLLQETSYFKERRKEIAQVRKQALARYGAILHVHRLRADQRTATMTHNEDMVVAKDAEPWHGSSKIRVYRDSLIGLKDTSTPRSLRTALHEYAVQSFNENYDLRDGVPESLNNDFDIAAVDRLPISRFDPGKAARVAAFSGWMFASREELHDLDRLLDDRKRLYERTLTRVEKLNWARSK